MNEYLSGWKQISSFLGVTPKTAQRWRRTRGLPVAQVVKNGMVVVSKSDLQEWLELEGTEPKRRA